MTPNSTLPGTDGLPRFPADQQVSMVACVDDRGRSGAGRAGEAAAGGAAAAAEIETFDLCRVACTLRAWAHQKLVQSMLAVVDVAVGDPITQLEVGWC